MVAQGWYKPDVLGLDRQRGRVTRGPELLGDSCIVGKLLWWNECKLVLWLNNHEWNVTRDLFGRNKGVIQSVCELRLSESLEYSMRELFMSRSYLGRGVIQEKTQFVNIGQYIIFRGTCQNEFFTVCEWVSEWVHEWVWTKFIIILNFISLQNVWCWLWSEVIAQYQAANHNVRCDYP